MVATTKKRSATKKRSGSSASGGKKKIGKVMHEFKEGSLKSSSGAKVTSRKQAVAIALSEAREAGANIPENPNDSRGTSKGK